MQIRSECERDCAMRSLDERGCGTCELLGIFGGWGFGEGQLGTAAPEVAGWEINQREPQDEERAVACQEQ